MGLLQAEEEADAGVGCPQGRCGLPVGSGTCEGERRGARTASNEGPGGFGVTGWGIVPEEKAWVGPGDLTAGPGGCGASEKSQV